MYKKRNSPRNVLPNKTAYVWIVETLSSTDTDDCMPWPFGKYKNGYGMVAIKQVKFYAHRLSYIIVHGSIPTGKRILHSCDNPPCFNPRHLRSGSAKDNTQDAIARKRMHCGERSGPSKLKDADIAMIRSGQYTAHDMAIRFGVSYATIRRVILRQIWRHLQ